jgi:hypothetical protein
MLATALVNGKTQGVLAAPVANPSLGAFKRLLERVPEQVGQRRGAPR